tara:strand:+ start:5546 stop:5812 length:267 start_codon:yes stop_codon:yes gene_type:complete
MLERIKDQIIRSCGRDVSPGQIERFAASYNVNYREVISGQELSFELEDVETGEEVGKLYDSSRIASRLTELLQKASNNGFINGRGMNR